MQDLIHYGVKVIRRLLSQLTLYVFVVCLWLFPAFCALADGIGTNIMGSAGGERNMKQGRRIFRLMTYNIRHGEGIDCSWNLWRTVETVKKARPDVATFQEVDCRTGRSFGADEPAMMAELLPSLGHSRFQKSIDFDGGEYGIAMLSAEEPLSVREVRLPGFQEARSFLLCEFEHYFVGTTHLSLHEDKRIESVSLIAAAVSDAVGRTGKPVFFTGDLNAEPDSQVLAAIREKFVILSDPNVKTFPADKPSICIDYIAVDKAHAEKVSIRSVECPPEREASDHRPIIIEFELLP